MSVDAYKFLIDENLSPRLVGLLSDVFPGSTHIRDVGLKGRSDDQIWIYAASHGYTILTKDDDFRSMSLLRGAPPKVIWLVVGNRSTAEILRLVLANSDAIQRFLAAPQPALLAIRTR
jgi:predicted nuclease of predicted toxin-antitoxin system